MVHLIGLSTADLEQFLSGFNQPAYRARQLAAWLYRRRAREFAQMTDLPTALREALTGAARVRSLATDHRQDAPDGTSKLTFRLADGDLVEGVYLPYADRVSLCVSTQVGCPAGCAFCATGRMGFARNLNAGEIVEQYLSAQDEFPNRRISHVVFMGMGEPLLNADATIAAARLLINEVQVSARNLTISTVGLVPGILRLASEGLHLNLAVSLHAPDDELRRKLVPTAAKWSLAEILAAADAYREKTGRDVTYEYVLLDGVNDSVGHAEALVRLLGKRQGTVNVIPYNPVEGAGGFRPPARPRIEEFKAVLRRKGRPVTERVRRGRGARAACGQLAITRAATRGASRSGKRS